MTTRNEAAERLPAFGETTERLRNRIRRNWGDAYAYAFDEALAAEYRRGLADGASDNAAVADRTRRATVERIRARLNKGSAIPRLLKGVHRILDEEAAR